MYKSSDFTKPVYKTGEIMEILNILTFQSKFQFIWNLIRKTLSKRPTGIYFEKHDCGIPLQQLFIKTLPEFRAGVC